MAPWIGGSLRVPPALLRQKILCSQGHTCELSLETVEAMGCNNQTSQLLDFSGLFCAEE